MFSMTATRTIVAAIFEKEIESSALQHYAGGGTISFRACS
jgi:hypothetical protein